MKRFIVACQIVIVAFFIVRIVFLTEALRFTPMLQDISADLFGHAMAQTAKPETADPKTAKPAGTNASAEIKDVLDDPLKKERDLFISLQKKQKELDAREASMKAEEQKLLALKKEVMDKIDGLKAMETQLSAKLDTDKTNDVKRLKELAKVYDAAPPQKAAAMLEKLEVKTAAGITINMKRDRAGLVWGYLTPQKAVAITHEITRTPQQAAE